MPKYYCDYCDKFLTHDSPSVRKTHCTGRTHKNSVREYYQKWLEEQVQKLVDHACIQTRKGASPHVWWRNGYTPSGHARNPACGCFPPPISSDDAGSANGDKTAHGPPERDAGRRCTSRTADASHLGPSQAWCSPIRANLGDDATSTGADPVSIPV
uniref:Matrin-type domain-containing protein n=1 Tax=Echinococcus canadensis TaxID=519352 RepID=A0A915EY44_9CEST